MRMAWKSLETTDSLTFRASILDFKAKLANRCSTIVVAVENDPPAMAVAARGSASDSNFRCHYDAVAAM